MERLGGIVGSNVRGDGSQIVPELVTSTVEQARDRPGYSCAVKPKVSERDNLVVPTVVEEEPRDWSELLSNVARQL